MKRETRYQAAILRGDELLLLKVVEPGGGRTYWQLPGGGREEGETEEECLLREVREETFLTVVVERALSDQPGYAGHIYRRLRTYLCRVVAGEARPGREPEFDSADCTTIRAAAWFDLRAPETWDRLILADPFTMEVLHRLRVSLGYEDAE